MLAEHRKVKGEAPLNEQELAYACQSIRQDGYLREDSRQAYGVTDLSAPISGRPAMRSRCSPARTCAGSMRIWRRPSTRSSKGCARRPPICRCAATRPADAQARRSAPGRRYHVAPGRARNPAERNARCHIMRPRRYAKIAALSKLRRPVVAAVVSDGCHGQTSERSRIPAFLRTSAEAGKLHDHARRGGRAARYRRARAEEARRSYRCNAGDRELHRAVRHHARRTLLARADRRRGPHLRAITATRRNARCRRRSRSTASRTSGPRRFRTTCAARCSKHSRPANRSSASSQCRRTPHAVR